MSKEQAEKEVAEAVKQKSIAVKTSVKASEDAKKADVELKAAID